MIPLDTGNTYQNSPEKRQNQGQCELRAVPLPRRALSRAITRAVALVRRCSISRHFSERGRFILVPRSRRMFCATVRSVVSAGSSNPSARIIAAPRGSDGACRRLLAATTATLVVAGARTAAGGAARRDDDGRTGQQRRRRRRSTGRRRWAVRVERSRSSPGPGLSPGCSRSSPSRPTCVTRNAPRLRATRVLAERTK